MDNQTNNQEPTTQLPLDQEPVNQEPINQEPVKQETPVAEQPQLEPQPEAEPSEPEIPETQPEATVPSNEYQQVLDQYAATREPPVMEETPPQPQAPPQDPNIYDIPVTPKTGPFKILFNIALVIFILVLAGLGFVYFKSQKNSSTINDHPSTIKTTPTLASGTCFLNDKTFSVGESFVAADNCNTCSCTPELTIVCTEKACTPTPIVTKSATPSATIIPTKVITPTKTTTPTATPSVTK